MESFDAQSVRFIRRIKAEYGPDAASKCSRALEEILGRAWATNLTYNTLADTYTTQIQIMIEVIPNKELRLINAIKELRTINNSIGLKEAKDIIELARNQGVAYSNIDPQLSPIQVVESIENMEAFGFKMVLLEAQGVVHVTNT